MHYPVVTSLVFMHSLFPQAKDIPASKIPEALSKLLFAPSSAGPHRIGRGTFTLFCGRYHPSNSRYLRIGKETVWEILPATRGSASPCRTTHSCTFHFTLGSVGAPFDVDSDIHSCHLAHGRFWCTGTRCTTSYVASGDHKAPHLDERGSQSQQSD